ncbi:unnamed protein product, partial [Trichogramma brassicae]
MVSTSSRGRDDLVSACDFKSIQRRRTTIGLIGPVKGRATVLYGPPPPARHPCRPGGGS